MYLTSCSFHKNNNTLFLQAVFDFNAYYLAVNCKNREDKCGWQLGALYLSAFASGHAVYKVGTRYSILPDLLYGREAWVMTRAIKHRKMAFERKCYRKLLRIGWTQKVTYTDLYSRIKPNENIMQKLIGRTWRLFGHICRMHNRRIKELMFGKMEGANRRGRPHREWLEDITEFGKASL